MAEIPSLTDYWKQCDAHRWYYALTDVKGDYTSGVKVEEVLLATAKAGGPVYQELYDAFYAHHFKGQPKPYKPLPLFDLN